jgi:hypothetical protein
MAPARYLAVILQAALWATVGSTPAVVTTLAGDSCPQFSDSAIALGGLAAEAQVGSPTSVAFDASTGTTYIAMPYTHCVAKVRRRVLNVP